MGDSNSNIPDSEPSGKEAWWDMPFDSVSNFSLLGFLYGGAHWTGNPDKRVDLTLED